MKCPECKIEINLKAKQIDNEIYGPNGLYNRIVDKMNQVGRKETIQICNRTGQNIDGFKRKFREDPRATKESTLREYAGLMGVE